MGMAASQARFLGLTARKTNLEFEGQQINQQRTSLANQSANYYNDLLGMSVPVPPSVDSFTKTVYTFDDGALTNEITAMIATGGTYTLSYLSKWQDDYVPIAASTSIINVQDGKYYVGATVLRELGKADTIPVVGNSINIDGVDYTVRQEGEDYVIDKITRTPGIVPCTEEDIANFEYSLIGTGLEDSELVYKDEDGSFYTLDDEGNKVERDDLTEDMLVIYLWDETATDPDKAVTLVQTDENGKYVKEGIIEETEPYTLSDAEVASITTYPGLEDDPYFGGLTSGEIADALREEAAWAAQLEQKYGTNEWYVRYVTNTTTGEAVPYFYKKSELDENAANTDENGNILTNINCYTIGSDVKVKEVKGVPGCRVERDSSGRFISISIPNPEGDGYSTYALTTSTVTDQDAYNDAMNEYEHEKYLYDQAIDQINAKIEIIQAQDKNLELRLQQLDTEQNAIQTEMDSVEKVIEKNVEGTFKTFG